MDETWKLRSGIDMSPEAAAEVAKIACALKSLSAYTSLVCESDEDAPSDLQSIVDEGLEAMQKIFVW
ncbi:MAG: hypothetical protein PHZ14_07355 [Sulfuricella sp.]|jgi:hypothetical protein|nr:hypothetical protein [Sulfuricella sp.]